MNLYKAEVNEIKTYEDDAAGSLGMGTKVFTQEFSIPNDGTKLLAATLECDQADNGFWGIFDQTDTSITGRYRNENIPRGSTLRVTLTAKMLYM